MIIQVYIVDVNTVSTEVHADDECEYINDMGKYKHISKSWYVIIQTGLFEELYEPANEPSHTVFQNEMETTNATPTSDTAQCQLDELDKCSQFVRVTCGCTKANGKPCSNLFSEEHYADLRAQAAFLTHEQLDLVILGSVMATINTDDSRLHGRHKPAKRQKTTMIFMHHGHHLCSKTYNFLHGLGTHRVKFVRKSYLTNGLTPRTHGNSNRVPNNVLSYTEISNLLKFIQNYAEQHAILLPGRIPGYKRDDLKLLPCSDTKKVSHKLCYFALVYELSVNEFHYQISM